MPGNVEATGDCREISRTKRDKRNNMSQTPLRKMF